MRDQLVSHWSLRSSFIHEIDPRAKLLLLLAFIVCLSTSPIAQPRQLGLYLLGLFAWCRLAALPLRQLFGYALLVIPLVAFFSLAVFLSGDHARAGALLARTYLSTSAVLITTGTTPVSQLLSAARRFGVPFFLLDVTHLIYRYLFTLKSESVRMQIGFVARGGKAGKLGMNAAAGMIAVLFGRSYQKAIAIHQAMAARGFAGTMPKRNQRSFNMKDAFFLLVSISIVLLIRLATP